MTRWILGMVSLVGLASAGALANTFVEFHRFTAAAYKLPMCELFIGAAALIAEYNGIPKVTHIRDKLMELIAWTETTRGLLVAASLEHKMVPPGIAVPHRRTLGTCCRPSVQQ